MIPNQGRWWRNWENMESGKKICGKIWNNGGIIVECGWKWWKNWECRTSETTSQQRFVCHVLLGPTTLPGQPLLHTCKPNERPAPHGHPHDPQPAGWRHQLRKGSECPPGRCQCTHPPTASHSGLLSPLSRCVQPHGACRPQRLSSPSTWEVLLPWRSPFQLWHLGWHAVLAMLEPVGDRHDSQHSAEGSSPPYPLHGSCWSHYGRRTSTPTKRHLFPSSSPCHSLEWNRKQPPHWSPAKRAADGSAGRDIPPGLQTSAGTAVSSWPLSES